MKKILSIILICVMVFATFSITSVLAVSESTAKGELIYLLQYYCWDFDYTPEYWYSIYTKESYDAYLLAKQKAEELIANKNTTDEEFQNMIKEFQTARKNLISVGENETEVPTSPTEFTEPSEMTSKEKLIYTLQYYCWDFDYTPEYWYSIYTKESYDAYLLAKQKAEELIANKNTTDEEFQNMIKEFQTARENLICVGEVETEASTDLVETTKPTENSELPQKTESVTSRVNKESSTIANSKTFNAVNTGDNSSLCIWFVVLLLSFGNVICTIFFTKRKNIFKN